MSDERSAEERDESTSSDPTREEWYKKLKAFIEEPQEIIEFDDAGETLPEAGTVEYYRKLQEWDVDEEAWFDYPDLQERRIESTLRIEKAARALAEYMHSIKDSCPPAHVSDEDLSPDNPWKDIDQMWRSLKEKQKDVHDLWKAAQELREEKEKRHAEDQKKKNALPVSEEEMKSLYLNFMTDAFAEDLEAMQDDPKANPERIAEILTSQLDLFSDLDKRLIYQDITGTPDPDDVPDGAPTPHQEMKAKHRYDQM